MSLGIAFKGPEGIVLAADSRVTLTVIPQLPSIPLPPGLPAMMVPATFDNATKLLRVKGQGHVGAVTYGIGAIGKRNRERRTVSFPSLKRICHKPVMVMVSI